MTCSNNLGKNRINVEVFGKKNQINEGHPSVQCIKLLMNEIEKTGLRGVNVVLTLIHNRKYKILRLNEILIHQFIYSKGYTRRKYQNFLYELLYRGLGLFASAQDQIWQ
jgi:hypothetical protein